MGDAIRGLPVRRASYGENKTPMTLANDDPFPTFYSCRDSGPTFERIIPETAQLSGPAPTSEKTPPEACDKTPAEWIRKRQGQKGNVACRFSAGGPGAVRWSTIFVEWGISWD